MNKFISLALCLILMLLCLSTAGCSQKEEGLSFGMNIHHSGYQAYPASDLEQNILSCKEMGMDIVRYNRSSADPDSIEEIKRVSKLCHKNGMKLMLVVDSTGHYTMAKTVEEIEAHYKDHFYNLSATLGDAVDIYQIFNEMDVRCIRGNNDSIFLQMSDGNNYDCVMYERCIAAVKGALKGIEEGYSKAKTCINFSWWHTALVYDLYKEGCRWDIVGLDWYSDCEEVSTIEELMNDVAKNIPESDIMICETNYWVKPLDRYTEEHKAELQDDETRHKLQAEWVPKFVDKLVEINNPKLKAVIFYELMDEPAFEESKGSYEGESHFGFIACDENGQNRKEKPVFYTLKEKIAEIKGK